MKVRCPPLRGDGHHQPPAHTDGHRLLSQLPGLPVQAERSVPLSTSLRSCLQYDGCVGYGVNDDGADGNGQEDVDGEGDVIGDDDGKYDSEE